MLVGLLCNFINVLFFPLGLASLILIIIKIIIIIRGAGQEEQMPHAESQEEHYNKSKYHTERHAGGANQDGLIRYK